MLLAAMGIGALVGGVAGLTVYAVKAALSDQVTWSWRDAAAHAAGGVVGGGLFPPLLVGLTSLGVPATVAYVASGGIAWGGVWTLAQDGASVALGQSGRLSSPRHYLEAAALGAAASRILLPLASRTFKAGALVPHARQAKDFVMPATTAEVLKAEGEFLAFGALTEGGKRRVREQGPPRLPAGQARVAPTSLPAVEPDGLPGGPVLPRAARAPVSATTPAVEVAAGRRAEAPPGPAAPASQLTGAGG